MSNIKLSKFDGFKIEIEYKNIIDKYSNDTVKYLKRTSPVRKTSRANNYASGWDTKKESKNKGEYGVVVWNATNYQLTHLLEKGHLIVNKKGGVGWASPRPHIDNAYQHIKQPFINAMENAKISFK